MTAAASARARTTSLPATQLLRCAMSQRRLRRNTGNKILGGVCSGLADYFAVDATVVRLIFVLAFLLFGSGILLYIILWIVMPAE